MKKKLIFLITFCALIISCRYNVSAKETSFYEAEYIDNIWMNKSPGINNQTIYYQKARFFREVGTNKFAYCIEPAAFFEDYQSYNDTLSPYNLSSSQIERIKTVAHFGYQYTNHNDNKWYAITQFMIWKIADPYGDYYFTDGLNGRRIEIFNDEINEINSLVDNYLKKPSFTGKKKTIVEGTTLIVSDSNKVLSNYKTNVGVIKGNTLVFEKAVEGNYNITLERIDNIFNEPLLFYQAANSQNLVTGGDIDNTVANYNLNVIKTKIKVSKIDSDTQKFETDLYSKLQGSIFKLYNSKKEEIETLEINDEGYAEIENLEFGKYYIQEETPGEGYKLNEKIYEVNLTDKNYNITISIENEKIKKKVIIHKIYGSNYDFKDEKNVLFNIYNSYNELVETISTDEYGLAEITLTYGKYYIKQISTTEGYEKVIPFTIDVHDEEIITYTLKDYKIKVPDTYIKESLINKIIAIIIGFLC